MACRSFWSDESGAEMVEWVVVTLAVGLAGFSALAVARDRLGVAFDRIIGDFTGW